ncbi:hypothetical protein D3C72_2420990 [compost metagenome]
MVPMPIEISEPPWVCANIAPANATSALDSAMPASVARPVAMPWARAMRGLAPVARIARPSCELKNQSRPTLAITTTTNSTSGRST